MTTIINTINKLPDMLPLKAASNEVIDSAEKELKLIFAEEYKEYLRTYGALIADGVDLTGIAKADYRNVVKVTKQGWKLNDKVPKNLYVIEDTRVDGIMIWQDAEGIIYKTIPNNKPEKICDSLSEYLLRFVEET